METNNVLEQKKTPWHFWGLALLLVSLFAIGTYDYIMVMLKSDTYYSARNYTADVIKYFNSYPIFPKIFWTIHIFTGLAAICLYVLKSRYTTLLILVSVVTMFILDISTFGFMNRWGILGPKMCITDLVVLLMLTVIFFYCRYLTKKNILK